jgi:hypothetical protein
MDFSSSRLSTKKPGIGAAGQAGGNSVAAELTTLVETETQFWKQTAPSLKQA